MKRAMTYSRIGRASLLAGFVVMLFALAWAPGRSEAAPQGPWVLPAADLSALGQDAYNPQIAFVPDGTTIAVWERSDGSNQIIQAAIGPPGGNFGAPINLSVAGQDANNPQIAIGPDGTATAVWYRSNGSNTIIRAATRPPGGNFGAPVNLSVAGQDASSPQIAIGPDGTTTAVWSRSGGSNEIIQAATRPPGGSFGTPVNLSAVGQSAFVPQIAIGPDRAATVVWRRSDGSNQIIQTAIRPPGGSFGAPVNLSVAGQNARESQIETGPDGTAAAVWKRSDGSDDIIQVATRLPGGSFGAPVDLSAAGQDSDNPQIAFAPDGTVTAVWQRSDGSNEIVQVRTRPPGGPTGPVLDLSATGQDARFPQIAIAPDGTATAIWRRQNGSGYIIQASTRPPGGSFPSPPDAVDLTAGQNSYNQQVAIGPDGAATAVWYYTGTNDIIQTASTEAPDFTLDVTKEGAGGGTVTSAPTGIDCGADCTEDYTSYTKVTLTATPETGSSFTGWSGACDGAAGMTCELTMVEAKSATADFTADPPPPVVCPPKTLKTGKLKKNKKKGTAKLAINAGGEGKVVLKGSKKVKKSSKKVGSNGKGKLTVKAKGKAAKKLKKNGKVKAKVKLVYKPGGDCPNKTKTKKIKLVRK